MNCEQMNELLSAWLDGELSENEQRQMQAHLEQCAQCRALFEQLQALHTSFSDMEEIPAPEGFAQQVMDRVRTESKPKVIPLFQNRQMRGFAAMAACAVLCVGLGGGLLSGKSEESAAPAPEAAYAFEYSAATSEGAMEVPAEYAPQATTEPEVPAMEPAAPAPEMTVQKSAPFESNISAGEAWEEPCELVLRQLPEGLEEKLGALAWEERLEDGARCARLSAEQTRILMDMVRQQELDFEVRPVEREAEENWILIWLPN